MIQSLLRRVFGERWLWAYRYYRYPQYFEIVGGPLTFAKDGLYTKHNSDSLKDPLFQKSYSLAQQTGSFSGSWGQVDPEYRAYIYAWSAFHCKDLDGDYVECGVNKGGMARAAIHFSGFTASSSKKFFLLDTYQGTPEHSLLPEETRRNKYDECYEDVKANFKEFPNVIIIRGEVPHTLSQVTSSKICFLSLDMNAVGPEIAAIEFFWDKISSGGIVVLDDYNNIGHELQKKGFDDFAQRQGLKVMSLPTGQGLIFKH
ncbi:MAG: TylF/MycF family methyltransferase [Bdellovibrionales bacterium]|nr:TylF/MycF family methyltransferase [Bdellovibrionales bacterium]